MSNHQATTTTNTLVRIQTTVALNLAAMMLVNNPTEDGVPRSGFVGLLNVNDDESIIFIRTSDPKMVNLFGKGLDFAIANEYVGAPMIGEESSTLLDHMIASFDAMDNRVVRITAGKMLKDGVGKVG